ncbi:MAG: radical SAM protein [Acidobacteria bacterium]|nr:radical SAM protein [Acidobacteriota bacterium]
MSVPRILLCYRADDRDAGDVFSRIAPYGLFTIHGFLRAHGIDSRLHNLTRRGWDDIARLFAAERPDAIGVSHFTFNHVASAGIYRAAAAAAPGALRVAGGPQATHLDHEVLARAPAPHVVVRGEGENPMLGIAHLLAEGSRDWSRVPGLSWLDGGELRRTPEAAPPDDIDPFHPPERYEELHGVDPGEQHPIVITSRGCPAQCTFCNTPFYWGRAMRFRGAANVADEIELVRRRWDVNYFTIRDDTFTASKGRVRQFCEELQRRRIQVLWNCQSRVNLVDEERLAWMKRAGCDQIQFGVEAASQGILEQLAKKITLEQIDRALRLCRARGIKTSAYFIVGVPGQTAADLEANARLFDGPRLMDGIVSSLAYYPGTSLFDDAKARGEVDEEIFFSGDVGQLYVRHDAEAKRQFRRMVAACERGAARNAFARDEIEQHLAASDRCWSALLDLGALFEAEGRPAQAAAAYREIVERFPDSPWGPLALSRVERPSHPPRPRRRSPAPTA